MQNEFLLLGKTEVAGRGALLRPTPNREASKAVAKDYIISKLRNRILNSNNKQAYWNRMSNALKSDYNMNNINDLNVTRLNSFLNNTIEVR